MRMTITHLSGEPTDPAGSRVTINSIFGLPTEKAEVTEDHLIETAGISYFYIGNEQYDKFHKPRLIYSLKISKLSKILVNLKLKRETFNCRGS